LALSKLDRGDGVLLVPLEQFFDKSETVPWEERTASKLVWRESTTGGYHVLK
jgi:hypothetical protein